MSAVSEAQCSDIPENEVWRSLRPLMSRLRHVRVGGLHILEQLMAEHYDPTQATIDSEGWHSHPQNPSHTDDSVADWLFVIDTLNFGFWHDDNSPVRVERDGVAYRGYWALCATVNNALDQGVPMCDWESLSSPSGIPDSTLVSLFTDMDGRPWPLQAERIHALRELGAFLSSSGGTRSVIESCHNDALSLVSTLTTHLSSFRDSCACPGSLSLSPSGTEAVPPYPSASTPESVVTDTLAPTEVEEGVTLTFNKRAQILVAELAAAFDCKDLGAFHNLHSITMFADYRVPQMLAHLGVIEYSPALLAWLEKGGDVIPGSVVECEMRAASIGAVQEVAAKTGISPAAIDFYLWDACKREQNPSNSALYAGLKVPMHRCRTIFY
ncbi:potential Queuosine, Q, salvage protein family [Kipferlia bialata]|uniref:Queuosine 5'-phosphate N-glycosylase/hydrolase n=1 Tax=Kipferlia bialata TaxID=797122 RepID=A0A9K3CRB5_9EUKA|nr:potential Queuosine, Q, salvage protein family [Kipferlia bialata]|eukprot:g2880.t1